MNFRNFRTDHVVKMKSTQNGRGAITECYKHEVINTTKAIKL